MEVKVRLFFPWNGVNGPHGKYANKHKRRILIRNVHPKSLRRNLIIRLVHIRIPFHIVVPPPPFPPLPTTNTKTCAQSSHVLRNQFSHFLMMPVSLTDMIEQ
jgi:hypothetical protein